MNWPANYPTQGLPALDIQSGTFRLNLAEPEMRTNQHRKGGTRELFHNQFGSAAFCHLIIIETRNDLRSRLLTKERNKKFEGKNALEWERVEMQIGRCSN